MCAVLSLFTSRTIVTKIQKNKMSCIVQQLNVVSIFYSLKKEKMRSKRLICINLHIKNRCLVYTPQLKKTNKTTEHRISLFTL